MERVVVFKNSNVERVLIALPPGYRGDTHDHPGIYCRFRILKGEMIEEREDDTLVYQEGQQGAIWDKLGAHRACSIHLYSKL